MQTVTVVLTIIGGGLLVLTSLAAGYVWVRRAGEIATIEAQDRRLTAIEGENADLRRRVATLEDENANLKIAVAQVHGIDHLQLTADAIKADTSAILMKVSAA